MPDMLCSLVRLPEIRPEVDRLRAEGITIRRANPWDLTPTRDFVLKHFTRGWADETEVAFFQQPITCFLALREKEILGFADYECTRKNYFGPTGVDPAERGKGLGKVLFIASLYGLRDLGYTYAIIGDAGPVDFYRKLVGAIPIELGNGKGIYGLDGDPAFLTGTQG